MGDRHSRFSLKRGVNSLQSNNSNTQAIISEHPVMMRSSPPRSCQSSRANVLQAFLICCHHTSVFITSAVVDAKFLDSVRLGQLNDNQFMCVKRSVKFDLAEKQG